MTPPASQLAEDRRQLAGPLGQFVVDARRNLAVALTGQHPVGDHPVQARAQLFSGDPGQHALELDEAPRAGEQVTNDQQRPLVADHVERACIRRPLVVRVALSGRNVWN